MKRLCFLTVAVVFRISAVAWADDLPAFPRAPLASGSNLPQFKDALPVSPKGGKASAGVGGRSQEAGKCLCRTRRR